ncbi:MAG: 1-deoxy-D-xylulose-5-phosphate reductoisomerase [Candidatus Marinimicrobia bacterium]|jgi:1-deoxy-D-xylulose-5-phosphate reductoisomerase|nr:1-deoxy-D-xylulose-5-phosphate reductoisomerase [Candidatus Neomarinimicrobiota bacterium]MBT3839019.1 1-deoxy-D-xylulose-5-phosphate reductoisomerase [Candidatus Neomarinimicrobiota bacterium]MBT3999306.1 1-deoxy-D-xylulose-5-phosphate reductoisomerase [Candidatus Neomarinimicrobiota bacterium]MBT4282742.1 1-deoxy-D-xylulose-5-phosphate reductoisomerase [Candidatus Neomarinimicrobiota bacterium]MBT4578306.1 1-deoxy-D-xylulose-5-phosphate reductoisomerase [Candidatus Neomarinimicrobiota bact
MSRRITILGSTGSIGVNALKVVAHLKDELNIVYLSANKNANLLIEQAMKFKPSAVCIVDEDAYPKVKKAMTDLGIETLTGREGLLELSARNDVDILLNGLVGAPGMEPTLKAIEAGIDVALSNKESLVMAGDIIKQSMKKTGAQLFPVDSEHSAIWQCMVGENIDDIHRLVLTGSGGPFRTRSKESFDKIKVEEALNHPNWNMGQKITIDSATMMNKGLEVIEAYWLFGFKPDQINIVIHPQSIIHSMIEMKDGAIKAQMGVPDMKVPIQYALTYPRHLSAPWEQLDFFNCGDLTFEEPDLEKFPCIKLAFDSLEKMGTSGAALNLANDYSVVRFLNGEIKFSDIPKINESSMVNHAWIEHPSLEELNYLDSWVKNHVDSF